MSWLIVCIEMPFLKGHRWAETLFRLPLSVDEGCLKCCTFFIRLVWSGYVFKDFPPDILHVSIPDALLGGDSLYRAFEYAGLFIGIWNILVVLVFILTIFIILINSRNNYYFISFIFNHLFPSFLF